MKLEMPRNSRDHRPWSGLDFGDDLGKCHPEFKDECDVNRLMGKYERSGLSLDEFFGNRQRPYGDISNAMSYHEALNLIADAQSQFNALDARVRQRFDNDPGKFLDFCSDPKNEAEGIEMGLATARGGRAAPEAPLVSVVPVTSSEGTGTTSTEAQNSLTKGV